MDLAWSEQCKKAISNDNKSGVESSHISFLKLKSLREIFILPYILCEMSYASLEAQHAVLNVLLRRYFAGKWRKQTLSTCFCTCHHNSIVLAHLEARAWKFDGKTLKFTRRLFHKVHKRGNLCCLIPHGT